MALQVPAGGEGPPRGPTDSQTAGLGPEGTARRHQRAAVAGMIAAVLICAGFVVYAIAVSRANQTSKYANVVLYASPAKVPSFDLASLGSKARVTSTLLSNGPAAVNWFQSTCVACQGELATFASVADQERSKVRFLGIDINDPSPAAALAMVRRARADYPVAEAPGVASISLATRFGVGDLPATVFVSPRGKILGEVLGKIPRTELVALLANLVAGRPLNA